MEDASFLLLLLCESDKEGERRLFDGRLRFLSTSSRTPSGIVAAAVDDVDDDKICCP